MSEIIKEAQPSPISYQSFKKIMYQMENSICKIQKDGINGAGFLCKIPISNRLIPFLITNSNILNKKDIDEKKIIKLTYTESDELKVGEESKNETQKYKEIKIDISRKYYLDKDITIIEIKPNKDKINVKKIFEIDKEEKVNLELKNNNKSIYIIDKNDLSISFGIINEIKDNQNINYASKIKEGSSGSPILSLETLKIIGIHLGISQDNPNLNYGKSMKYVIDEFIKKNNKYKNEINLIYIKYNENDDKENIFGETFVKNNKENIGLIINGKESVLVSQCQLKKGENIIKMIIKKKISNCECMFEGCSLLRNISDLEYLDVKDIKNFNSMFYGCSSLSDITSLEKWDVSNAICFKYMFSECSALSNLKPLENWNVSNVEDLSNMFRQCKSLSNLKPLENWNVSNVENLSYMFSQCTSLSNLKPLENWNVSNVKNFNEMFKQCKQLSDITPLKNWFEKNDNNFNDINFNKMFSKCPKLLDINSLNLPDDILRKMLK